MKNEGLCIQRDDMGDILKAYQQADILVLATLLFWNFSSDENIH